MDTFFLKTSDGKKLIRIEAPNRSTALAVVDQIEWGNTQDEIEECCGATITGAWYTFKGAKDREIQRHLKASSEQHRYGMKNRAPA